MSNIVTGKVRFSFVRVFEENKEGKYSVTMLIPKTDIKTRQNIDNAMSQALQDGLQKVFNGVMPNNPKLPIYDGDGVRPNGEAFGAECKGHWVITANTENAPEVVDINRQPILSKNEFYSGCYGRASLWFGAYNFNGSKGVCCRLNALQKLEDGEHLDGRISAEKAFAEPYNQPVQSQAPQPQVNPITGQPIANNIYGIN